MPAIFRAKQICWGVDESWADMALVGFPSHKKARIRIRPYSPLLAYIATDSGIEKWCCHESNGALTPAFMLAKNKTAL